MDLKGKACLVTGGTHGIGAAAALEMARRGADVAVAARHRDEEAERVLAEIEALGRRAVFLAADVGVPAEATRCVEEAAHSLGGVDVLIHSAGGPALGNILDVSPEVWYNAFDVHVHAVFHLCRAAIPLMRP